MKDFHFSRYLIALLLVIAVLLCSCNKNDSTKTSADTEGQPIKPVIERARHCVVVVLNSELGTDNVMMIKKLLDNSFGMIQINDSVIETDFITYRMYPDEFTREGIVRVSDIRTSAEDPRVRSIIMVMPPRYIGNYLSDIKKARPDIALMAALPESEILPMEAWCDIVLSFALPSVTTEETPPEEEENIQPAEIARLVKLLIDTIRTSELVQSQSQLLATCKKLALQTAHDSEIPWMFTNYKDPDSGLKATNHFVVIQDKKN